MDERLLDELKRLVLNRDSLPSASELSSASMRKELIAFRKRYSALDNKAATAESVFSFIEKYGLLKLMGRYLREFGERGKTLIIIEGGDATGKTTLAKRLTKDLDGVSIVNQSGFLFREIFGFPKKYKAVVIDYNRNQNVAFLYYFVQNIYVLERLLKMSKGKRFALLDSFVFRTLSSHRARPSFSAGSNRLISTGRLKRMIDGKLNSAALKIVGKNIGKALFIFLYSSEKSRGAQARERGWMDAFDSNKRYYSNITDYMKRMRGR